MNREPGCRACAEPQVGVPAHVGVYSGWHVPDGSVAHMDMYLEIASSVGARQVLTVRGELDMDVSALFEQALLNAVVVDHGGEVVVDLSGVSFFDASALRAVLRAAQVADISNVPFCFVTSRAVNRILEVLGVEVASVSPGSNLRRIVLAV